MATNIFGGSSIKAFFARNIYDKLMEREPVGYATILESYDKAFSNDNKRSQNKFYQHLKQAFLGVRIALENNEPGCLVQMHLGNKKNIAYKYVGKDNDPLRATRNATILKSIKDYEDFLLYSAGLFPTSWCEAYFKDTQILADINKELKSPTFIHSGNDTALKNINLLSHFYNAILEKKVLRFTYHPFTEEKYELQFHPQFIKEYNGRWFILGNADRAPYTNFNIALDRVESTPRVTEETEYIAAEEGSYAKYFADIVGVTHEKDSKKESVTIRTKSAYMHGLITTKPLHPSQRETKPFGTHNGETYGEVTIAVKPNKELVGRLLTFGVQLEVTAPASLRQRIKEEIKNLCDIYSQA